MCGIVGFTGAGGARAEVIRAMAGRIAHRGPDSSGEYLGEQIALGFRSLAFVDIKNGQQPMFNKDKTLVIVFNGEIYNHANLRNELLGQGRVFATNTDTEVILQLYEQEGPSLLQRLRGMFAFAIYNTTTNTLFAARDHFGIKPFYYTRLPSTHSKESLDFGFASEIKAFLEHPAFSPSLNHQALENYLTFQYNPLNETFFQGVYKLQPGHSLQLDANGEIHISKYFTPSFNPDNEMTMQEAVEKIDHEVSASVYLHSQADVELGSFLSGGVDSSYVASCFGGRTFSVGFDYDGYTELHEAKTLAEKLNIPNESRIITTEEFWQTFPKIQYFMDEPLADPSAVALYFVSELARKHVKGVMSGEGADELFGGYNIYREPLSLRAVSWLPRVLRRILAGLARHLPEGTRGRSFLLRAATPLQERFIGNANIFAYKERAQILKNPTGNFHPSQITTPFYEACANQDDITKMQHLDINLWLVGDILLKADKMSMAHSIELRVPLLDTSVFAVASKLPTRLRVSKAGTKLAFRNAAMRRLPKEVAERRKLGFPVPIRVWLRETQYYTQVKAVFESSAAATLFNQAEIVRLLEDHKNNLSDNSRKIWVIYTFLIWYAQFFTEAS